MGLYQVSGFRSGELVLVSSGVCGAVETLVHDVPDTLHRYICQRVPDQGAYLVQQLRHGKLWSVNFTAQQNYPYIL